jgi:hypothetical protein
MFAPMSIDERVDPPLRLLTGIRDVRRRTTAADAATFIRAISPVQAPLHTFHTFKVSNRSPRLRRESVTGA